MVPLPNLLFPSINGEPLRLRWPLWVRVPISVLFTVSSSCLFFPLFPFLPRRFSFSPRFLVVLQKSSCCVFPSTQDGCLFWPRTFFAWLTFLLYPSPLPLSYHYWQLFRGFPWIGPVRVFPPRIFLLPPIQVSTTRRHGFTTAGQRSIPFPIFFVSLAEWGVLVLHFQGSVVRCLLHK